LQGKCSCGIKLSKLEVQGFQSRQVWDVLIETIITEHRAVQATCDCGKKHCADFPKNIKNHTQYGESVKAISAYLSQYQLIPFERTQEIFEDLFSLNISQGTICNTNEKLFNSLVQFENDLKVILGRNDNENNNVKHADETGINIAGKTSYLHVLSNKFYTFLFAHKGRGHKAIDAMGVLANYSGILMHDFYSAYFKYPCQDIFCGAHLVRELTFSEEQEGHRWAHQLKRFLLDLNSFIRDYGIPTSKEQDLLEREYSEILYRGHIQCPPPKIREIKRKGRTSLKRKDKRSKSRCLLERFKNYRKGILLFMYDLKVPFTNNLAERDLRMAKVHEKISGCFRNIKGARIHARIRSFISTMKKQKLSIIDGM
jgi:transposase